MPAGPALQPTPSAPLGVFGPAVVLGAARVALGRHPERAMALK